MIASAGLILLCLAVDLRASCGADPSPPCQAFWKAEVVFSGTVTQAFHSPTYQKGDGANKWNYRDRIARFAVDEVFRGKLGPQVDVIATEVMPTSTTLADGSRGMKSVGESDCEYKFKDGERYVVYAHFRKINDGSLSVTYNRTRPIAQASEDLQFIRALRTAKPGGRVYGQAKEYKNELEDRGNIRPVGPIANAKIVVEGMGRKRVTFTDSEGRYQIKGLPAGEYSVQAVFPSRFITYPPQKVRITNRGCAELDFNTEKDRRFTGRRDFGS